MFPLLKRLRLAIVAFFKGIDGVAEVLGRDLRRSIESEEDRVKAFGLLTYRFMYKFMEALVDSDAANRLLANLTFCLETCDLSPEDGDSKKTSYWT